MRLSPQDVLAPGGRRGVPKDTGVDTHHARQVAMPTFYADCKESVSVAIKMEVAWAVRKAAKAASAGPATTWEELAAFLPDRAEVAAKVAAYLKMFPDVPADREGASYGQPLAVQNREPTPAAVSSSSSP